MERNREARRASVAAEMPESARSLEREKLGRSKSRRNDRSSIHGTNREDESTEESVNDDEDGNHVNDVARGGARVLQSNRLPLHSSTSLQNHHHHHHSQIQNQLQSRKSFPPATAAVTNVFRPVQPWKTGDEMIGVSVPRKARSASAKRSHESWVSGGGNGGGVIGEQILRQPSSSPARPSLVSAASPSTISPSSNISSRKKLSNGAKHRPPIKTTSKSSSPNRDELEIAEVLYGMKKQPEGSPNDSVKLDSRGLNKITATGEAKLRVSSATPNSVSGTAPQSSSSGAPPVAIAPKRKRPRPVNYNDEVPSIVAAKNTFDPSISKVSLDQTEKTAMSSSSLAQAVAELPSETVNMENKSLLSDSKKLNKDLVNRDSVEVKEDEAQSTKGSPKVKSDDNREKLISTKEEKFQIDLMTLPPQNGSSSPEKDEDTQFDTDESKPIDSSTIEPERKREVTEKLMSENLNINDSHIVESELKKARVTMEEDKSQRQVVNKEKFLGLQVEYAKSVRDRANDSFNGNKLVQLTQMQPKPLTGIDEPSITEKTVHQSSGYLPLPIAMPNLPPIGYMASQGVVSMNESSVSSTPFQNFIFSHPRPKKCATHNYIAKNIHLHQQFTKTNPFRQARAGPSPGSIYGLNACNLNDMASSEVHGKFQRRDMNSMQDKAQELVMFPGHVGKDKGSRAANVVDSAQKKHQNFHQQPLPAGVPNNILHGPAFIFPMSQPHAVAAASATLSVRPGSSKNPSTASSITSSTVSNSALASGSATGVAAETATTAISFNYPNTSTNDTQYLAMLQNGSYPFPIPANIGGAPVYTGTHAQAIQFFNGSFYSSQMVHTSQLQQQPQQLPPPQTPQKHLQNLQQRPQASSVDGGIGSLKSSPAAKYEVNQQLNQQCLPLESDKGGEGSPSTSDSRVSRTNMSVCGQNFALMTHPVSIVSATKGGTGNPSERKQQQPPPRQGAALKGGSDESLPPQAFAISFSSIKGGSAANYSSGLDISSMAQNRAILHNFPGGVRHDYPNIMAATHPSKVPQQKKSSHQPSSEVKNGGNDSFNNEEERKSSIGEVQHTAVGQSIAFSRSDLTDMPDSTIPVSTGAASAQVSGSSNSTSSKQQQQRQHQHQHQQEQMIQLQNHHSQYAVATGRSKMPINNGNLYSDQLPSSSLAAIKFSNSMPPFTQNLVQISSGSSQYPLWKNSVQPTISQLPSPPMPSAGSSTLSLKTDTQQQQNRIQRSHSQISFTGNLKSSTQPPNTSQGPAPPMVVGSLPSTSLSKGAGVSPGIATSNSTSNKSSQGSTLSPQHSKGVSPAVPRKSSPVGGITVLPPSSLDTKPQLLPHPAVQHPQKQQPNELTRQAMQQAQLFFSNPYMQKQAPNSASVASTASGKAFYYAQTQRKRPEQQQQPMHGSSTTSTAGMLSLSSTPDTVNSTNAVTSDPVKDEAPSSAAASVNTSIKGGGSPSTNPSHLMPPGFSYVNAAPSAVQLKVTEQKQPVGE